jgi:hypothetical protein
MIKSLGMLSLCMALVFVFSTASFAKTKASRNNGLSRLEVAAKVSKNIKGIKANCKNMFQSCFQLLNSLVAANNVWMANCNINNGATLCDVFATNLIEAANDWYDAGCAENSARNLDRTKNIYKDIDRKTRIKNETEINV